MPFWFGRAEMRMVEVDGKTTRGKVVAKVVLAVKDAIQSYTPDLLAA